jgi:hypothetical protein
MGQSSLNCEAKPTLPTTSIYQCREEPTATARERLLQQPIPAVAGAEVRRVPATPGPR